jgi:hypothetical protein
MWEFLDDWLSQFRRQIEQRLERFSKSPPNQNAWRPGDQGDSAPTNVGMANSLMGNNAPRPSGFEGLFAKLNKLSDLHSDEYKAANPEWNQNRPQHVIVDNPGSITGNDTPGRSRLDQMMDRLKGMHSNEYKARHPGLFQNRPAPQGTAPQLPRLSRLGRMFGGSGSLRQNRLVSMQRWLRRQRRRFSLGPQGMQRVGSLLTRGGYALQVGAGRLASMGGGQVSQYVASAMGRTGMLMQGAGTVASSSGAGGLMASAGITGAAVAGGAVLGVVAAAAGFVVATKRMGESLLDSQRHLGEWNGSIANTMAMTDIHRMRMDARLAKATSENTVALAGDMKRLREATQGLKEDFSNLGLKVASVAVQAATGAVNAWTWMQDRYADALAEVMGVEKELAEERAAVAEARNRANQLGMPGQIMFDQLMSQPSVPRQPLRPIP